ncbi:hypothetical protein OH76DRAFT_1402794 [Lentinus brumalis]|uniref:Uncharacterized protein n=1 Tax=Lentinus brumalis TaxID=2498619 RepID=A0A371DCS2_9APHY|nr:hypothetical protein OH76DRAFT_1402794 [Polyporus brumalis]
MDASKPAMNISSQPKPVQMSVTANPPMHGSTQTHQECRHERGRAERLRGGRDLRDYFLDTVECFMCFDWCEDYCECCANVVCCPCESHCEFCPM